MNEEQKLAERMKFVGKGIELERRALLLEEAMDAAHWFDFFQKIQLAVLIRKAWKERHFWHRKANEV